MEKETIDQVKLDFEAVNTSLQSLIDSLNVTAKRYKHFTKEDWAVIESQDWHEHANQEFERLSTLLSKMM